MRKSTRSYLVGLLAVTTGIGAVYLFWQTKSIYGGDAGDLAAAIITQGVPHPPGYPLYTSLGIVLTKIFTASTVAWKIGLLSSLSSLLSTVILFDLFYFLTKKILASILAVFALSLLYPIWLYSEVVEVFALNNLFIVTLLSLTFHLFYTKKRKYFYAFAFVLGLSLTHHQIIIFLFPALFFLLFKSRVRIGLGELAKAIGLFILGLSPYLYVIISSFYDPAVNWQGPFSAVNFINLVTRAGYGTFQAGSFIGHQPLLRLVNVYGFFAFFYQDFRILGLIFIFLGFAYLYRINKTVWAVVGIGAASYLFFIFYASFPLAENFMLGTFERFVQPLYIIISFYLFFGIIFSEKILYHLFKHVGTDQKAKIFAKLGLLLISIYPAGLFILNFPKISILKNDFTAENLGRDILNSVPSQSVLIISTDTPLFNTQYVYYAEKKWPGVKLIHLTKLYTPYYTDQLKKQYPDLSLPDENVSPKDKFYSLIDKNYGRFPIFNKLAFAADRGEWIINGLLFKYYDNKDLPDDKQILDLNNKLWSTYHDPLSASLSKYKNLLLSDTLRVYSLSHQEFGFWTARRGISDVAQEHLLLAQEYYPDDLDSYIILAQSYMTEKKCDKANQQINEIIKRDKDNANSYLLLTLNYSLCYKDEEKAAYYRRLYEDKSRGKETPLKTL